MKIAILSDALQFPTGYANQSRQIAKFMHDKGHEVHYFACGYQGATISYLKLEDGTEFPFKIYGQGKVPYFEDTLSQLLKKLKIDHLFILLDTFMLHGGRAWFLNVDTSPAQVSFWFPSDGGGGLPLTCENILKKVDHPVAMAEFGKKQVKDYHGLDVKHIPHGVDKDRFYKLPEDQIIQARQKWGLLNKFVIGTIARNQPRKMLDRTIKTLALLKDRIPEMVFFAHLDPNDAAQAWPLLELIKRYNLENKVIFTGMDAMKGFDWSQMNELYNVMDVFFLSTSGEGFGIPIIEAMACEIPVVATDYTTTPELVINNNAGLGIKLAGVEQINMNELNQVDYDFKVMNGTMTGSWMVERGLCDINEAADKIEYLYKNPTLRLNMGSNGRKAVIEKYDFNTKVGPAWQKLMGESIK